MLRIILSILYLEHSHSSEPRDVKSISIRERLVAIALNICTYRTNLLLYMVRIIIFVNVRDREVKLFRDITKVYRFNFEKDLNPV